MHYREQSCALATCRLADPHARHCSRCSAAGSVAVAAAAVAAAAVADAAAAAAAAAAAVLPLHASLLHGAGDWAELREPAGQSTGAGHPAAVAGLHGIAAALCGPSQPDAEAAAAAVASAAAAGDAQHVAAVQGCWQSHWSALAMHERLTVARWASSAHAAPGCTGRPRRLSYEMAYCSMHAYASQPVNISSSTHAVCLQC